MSVQTDEESPRLAPMISMADPHGAAQLISGFYPIESGSWRWTAGKFAVTLRPPRGAQQRGATLKARFTIPEPVMQRIHSTTLTAAVNGVALAPEEYTKAGDYTYTRDVESRLLQSDSVRVDFALQKYLPPGAVDRRELGVIVLSIGFESK